MVITDLSIAFTTDLVVISHAGKWLLGFKLKNWSGGLHSDSFVLYLIINLKTVWLFIIIITNWDVDVLIDIVLQDIDMRQNVG